MTPKELFECSQTSVHFDFLGIRGKTILGLEMERVSPEANGLHFIFKHGTKTSGLEFSRFWGPLQSLGALEKYRYSARQSEPQLRFVPVRVIRFPFAGSPVTTPRESWTINFRK